MEKIALPLVLKTGETNRFLREDCNIALDRMVENVSSSRVIAIVTSEPITNKNPVIRTTVSRLLAYITDRSEFKNLKKIIYVSYFQLATFHVGFGKLKISRLNYQDGSDESIDRRTGDHRKADSCRGEAGTGESSNHPDRPNHVFSGRKFGGAYLRKDDAEAADGASGL